MVLEKLENKKNRLGFKKTWYFILESDDSHECHKCGKTFEVNEFVRMNLSDNLYCYDCSESNVILGRLGIIAKIEPKKDLNCSEDKIKEE